MTDRENWYRRGTWSETDQEEFFSRLKRSRGAFHKAQYLMIQALHLQKSGLYLDALNLLKILHEEYRDEDSRLTESLLQKAECLWAIDARSGSFDAYLEALASQKKRPNMISEVAVSFAERFHEHDGGAYRELLLKELEEEIERCPFVHASTTLRRGKAMVQLLTALGSGADAENWQRIVDEARRKLTIDAIQVTNPHRRGPDATSGDTAAENGAKGRRGRAKSDLAKILDEMQLELRKTLKAVGFRVRGRAFNRTTDDGLIEVLSIQMGSFDPPGTAPVPGLSSSMYGKFTVNLGVYVPEVDKWRFSAEPRAFVQESLCAVRQRLGMLGPERCDVWWDIRRDPSLMDDLNARLTRDAFPFLERFQSRDAILSECVRSGYDRMGCFLTPPRIVCATILLERGKPDEARQLLAEQAKENFNPSHPEYVRGLAARMGLGSLDG